MYLEKKCILEIMDSCQFLRDSINMQVKKKIKKLFI